MHQSSLQLGLTQAACFNIPAPDAQLNLYPHVYSAAQSATLFSCLKENIQWQQDIINIHGRQIPIPRLNAWYGDTNATYHYSGLHFKPRPWFAELEALKQTAEKLAKTRFNSVLANLYRSGQDSVAWHSDDETELGKNPIIASLSFGAERDFVLKHKYDTSLKPLRLKLPEGSVLIMAGETQHYWLHQIPKTRKSIEARINLTFRWVMENP